MPPSVSIRPAIQSDIPSLNPLFEALDELDGTDIGWLQSFAENGACSSASCLWMACFERAQHWHRGREALIAEATRVGRAVTHGVVKIDPALQLYERLGFRTTHEDERKFYMRLD